MKRYSVILLLFYLFPSAGFSQEPKLMLPIRHSLGVATAVFSPDGKRLVTASLDNTAKIWDVESGKLLADLRGHTNQLYYADFSPDGKKIVTASLDSTAKIWDAVSTILLADLKGHTGQVYLAKFSPDGKKIVTSSGDSTAKIWDVESGKLLADLKGHTDTLWSALFSLDGKKIVTASEDSTAKIWDVISGKMLTDLRGHAFEVWSAQFSPDAEKIVTGSGDSTAKIWNVKTGELLVNLKNHEAGIRFAQFSPDGKKVLTGSDDGTAKIWNVETGSLLFDLLARKKIKKVGPSDIVSAANFSLDGKKILTVYFDSSAKIWDAATGVLLKDIQRKSSYVNSASFSPDGEKFSLALSAGNIEIWDVVTGNLLADLKGGTNFLRSFEYSPDGKRILVSTSQFEFGFAKILDAESGTLVINLTGKGNPPSGVFLRFSPDGKKVVAVAYDNTAKVYNAVTGALLLNLTGHKHPVFFAKFSPDGGKLFTVSPGDSTSKIWDGATGKQLVDLKWKGPTFESSISFSSDGKRIVTYLQDSTAKILDAQTGQITAELKGHSKFIQNLTFSPEGKKILSYSQDNTAKIWDAKTGTLLSDIREPAARIRLALFSPDGKRIALLTEETLTKKTILKILDGETGTLLSDINDIKQTISLFSLCQFSPNGKKIISAFSDGTIKTWDAETGALLRDIKGHTGMVSRIHFSPDNKKFVTASRDGTAKIWDSETGALLADLNEHTFNIISAQFSPDGKKVTTFSTDRTAKVWDAETGNSLYTFMSINEDYLVFDKYNHFDGSEAARKLLYFTCGTEIIELDQVKDQLWVPNLAERILNGETINAAKLSELNICNLTPVVDTIGQTALQYRFRITPRLGGLGPTVLYVNGIEVKRYMPQQLQQQKNDYLLSVDKKEVQKFFVANKENSITVKSLTTKNSISSRSVSISEKALNKSTDPPNLYAIVVGVSDYKGEELDLKFAAKDATDIANAIDISAKKLLNTDGKEHVFIYKVHTSAGRDKFPEKNTIKQLFAEISAKTQPNDILMIFFAGHGVVESDKNQFYFLTADASSATVSGALKNVGISTEEIAEWIKPQVMKAQKRILIFDACNSGQALKEMLSFNTDGKNMVASRGDDKGKQAKAIEKLNEKSGMFILSASAGDQKAYEMGKFNQGVLTYSLLKAIKEQPDVLEDRQYLNISRWFNVAEKTVNELARETGARQQPQLVSTSNFNIGVVDDEVRNKIVLPFEKLLFTRSDFRNADLRIDNLKLRASVDKQLDEISGNSSSASIVFSPEYDGANIYAISGDYTVTGNEVSVSVMLTKGGTEIKTKFEIKGTTTQPGKIADLITTAVLEWANKNK